MWLLAFGGVPWFVFGRWGDHPTKSWARREAPPPRPSKLSMNPDVLRGLTRQPQAAARIVPTTISKPNRDPSRGRRSIRNSNACSSVRPARAASTAGESLARRCHLDLLHYDLVGVMIAAWLRCPRPCPYEQRHATIARSAETGHGGQLAGIRSQLPHLSTHQRRPPSCYPARLS